jgi:D-aminoacyl-tRNA deacylase
MKVVIQRVKKASLFVDNALISSIEKGLCLYFGVEKNDSEEYMVNLAKKISNLRIFEDSYGKMNLSIKEINGEILLISQFTLLADCSHGNRPDFVKAESPQQAKLLYEAFGEVLGEQGITVKYGVFGANMSIIQENDGPVTIIL